MGQFTFVPLWIVQDLLILGLSAATLIFILRHEERPESILLELFAFCFFYAAVYENFATMMNWYGYGRSILMVFNVPFTIPLVEYLVVYATLRLLAKTRMPGWAKPFVVGLSGMVFDFSLDSVALKQVFATKEGVFGRWTWYPAPGSVQIFGEPVYNFTGWILLCGFSAATFLLGRWWYKKSDYKPAVGLAYPFLSALAALLVLVSPLSQFLLWLGPFNHKGSVAEWIMLAVDAALGLGLLIGYGRKRHDQVAGGPKDITAWLVLAGLPLSNFAFALFGGYWEVLWLVALACAASLAFTAFLALGPRSQRAK